MHYFTLDLMKQAGGNWVRWGHCAAGASMIEADDQLGIMVEQPGLDGESDTRGAAWKLRAMGFRDMLIYFRNNPSIMIWEGGNQKVTREHAKELRDYVETIRSERRARFAFRRSDKVVAEFETAHIGTEGGREIKSLPVIEGEYDREESPRRVWDDFSPPNFGYPEAKGMTYDLTSEQFAVNEVEQWVKKCGATDHSGGVELDLLRLHQRRTRARGSRPRRWRSRWRASSKGSVLRLPDDVPNRTRRFTSSDIGPTPRGTTKTIYVVSNGDDVELSVNGKSLGHSKAQNRYLFTFKDVKFEPGEIKAVASLEGKPIATDTIKTDWRTQVAQAHRDHRSGGLLADGSDIALIDVEAVDANGQRCPTFQQRCDFTCTGAGIWRGGYNSGKEHSTNNPYVDLECGINRVAVKSTLTPGTITVEATVKGLPPASIQIVSRPVSIHDGLSDELPALPAQAGIETPRTTDPRLELSPSNQIVQVEGKLITGFSYSGPKGGASVKSLADDGDQLYTDRDLVAKDLPGMLKGKGGEYIQVPCADANFSALDLIQFSAGADVDVYIAHDNSVAAPKWLTSQFKEASTTFSLGEAKFSLFKRSTKKDSSLTLGSNFDEASPGKGMMYIVIAIPK